MHAGIPHSPGLLCRAKEPGTKGIMRKAAAVLCESGYPISKVSEQTGCSVSTVHRSVQRFRTTGHLEDLPRTGRPRVYPGPCRLGITGFYCQSHPFPHGGRWTLRMAAAFLKAHPARLQATPGKSTIHRILQENDLKPHRSRYFLHITDPNFFPKMEHLLDLYANPPKHLYFFDECPGIQLLKRILPDINTDTTNTRLEEFEYSRNGTMDVLAFYTFHSGKVFAECKPDHTTATFTELFARHVESCPDEHPIHYVMDNLAAHRGYSFCKMVAELSNVDCPSEKELRNLSDRVAWLRSEHKRIVVHFTPYHGSWLNLVEFWFGIMNKKVLRESYGSAQELMENFRSFLHTWNTLLAHPFRFAYDGKGLQQKAVTRFTAIIEQPAQTIEIRGLTKQLQLMCNILLQYEAEVPVEQWEILFTAIQKQLATIKTGILQEESPTIRDKAETALSFLMSALKTRLSNKSAISA